MTDHIFVQFYNETPIKMTIKEGEDLKAGLIAELDQEGLSLIRRDELNNVVIDLNEKLMKAKCE